MTELPERFNLASALLDAHLAAGRESAPAIRSQGRTLSYGEVARLANRIGNALRGLGVRVEQRVALLLLDSPEFIATFFGAIKIGAVPLPLSTLLTSADYAYALADSRAKVAVVSAPLWPAVAGLRRELPHLRHVVVARHEGVAGDVAADALELRELCAAASGDLDPEPTRRDDMCFWQYSSGTTGAPKAVVHLQHDLWEVTERYGRNVLGMSAADRSYSVPKLYFSYGLGNSLAFPFRYGATVLLDALRPDPRRTYELLAGERPTLFYAVPTFYASLLAVPEEDVHADLSSVRLCISAGELLPKPLYERWKQRFGLEILDGIGSTEVGYIFISNAPGRVRPGTSGRVVPGYQAKVVDDDGRLAATGETGTLWVKGASSFAFYWNQHERTKSTILGEWVVTGDRYSIDADGYFLYRGRTDDMLKVGGRWVSPVEVESALLEHPAVAECAVVGREDEDELTKPVAYAVLRDGGAGSAALAEELRAFARQRLARYKCPRWIEFVAALPKTATGKVQRYRLRERAREPEGAA